jgi:translocation and assembly module TamA
VTHQGTIGYGTDTEFRTQYRYHRHQLSSRGDVLIAGFSWQSRDEEILLFGEYRLPRRTEKLRYWQLNPTYRERDERFELEVAGRDETIPVADYRLDALYLRMGHLTFRSRGSSVDWLQETLFVDYLSETNRIERLYPTLGPEEGLDPEDIEPISTNTLAFGIEWNWPRFEGRGFDLRGHRERAWLLTANESLGSDVDFTQAYLSSRWNIRLADRWRLLLRGEVGYSDAAVTQLELEDQGERFAASLTALPNRYRFRAGGSHSVRGYDFEELSNNGVGSNHLLTASVEFEFRLTEQWTAAAFIDTGNAFNDWNAMNLSTGAGVGVRWYTAGFPLRLDVAQAQSLEGKPWRIHFTIGSPLF